MYYSSNLSARLSGAKQLSNVLQLVQELAVKLLMPLMLQLRAQTLRYV
jgi:hypothetical protein